MAVPFSNTKLRVPKGFQNILECLAREVLRSQPDNIHEFAAAYFEKLLKVRAETGHDPAVHGAKLEDRNYNNETFKKRTVDPSDPQQSEAALKIQTQFRQHSAKEEVQAMKEEVAATRIQAGIRGYMDREEVRKMKEGEQEEEVDIDLNDPEVEKAAIKIQAGFKGFKARKEVQGEGQEAEQQEAEAQQSEEPAPAQTEQQEAAPAEPAQQKEEEVDIDLEDPATEKAALKIQAGFRGYQTRKDLREGEGAPQTEQAAEAPSEQAPAESSEQKAAAEPEEEIDIDLNDPEVEKAATKIQAGFKGMKARKELEERAGSDKKEDEQAETVDAGEAQSAEEASPAAEEQQAATEESQQEAAPAEQTEAQAEQPQEDQAAVEEEKPEEAAAPPVEAAEESQGQVEEGEGQTAEAEGESQAEQVATEEPAAAPEAEQAPAGEEVPAEEPQQAAQEEAGEAAPEGEGEGQAPAEATEDAEPGKPGKLVHTDKQYKVEVPGLFYQFTFDNVERLGLTVFSALDDEEIAIQKHFKFITVKFLHPEGVGAQSGLLQIGDVITKVNGHMTAGMTVQDFTDKIDYKELLHLEIFRTDVTAYEEAMREAEAAEQTEADQEGQQQQSEEATSQDVQEEFPQQGSEEGGTPSPPRRPQLTRRQQSMRVSGTTAQRIVDVLSAFPSYKRPETLPARLRLPRNIKEKLGQWRQRAEDRVADDTNDILQSLTQRLQIFRDMLDETDDEETEQLEGSGLRSIDDDSGDEETDEADSELDEMPEVLPFVEQSTQIMDQMLQFYSKESFYDPHLAATVEYRRWMEENKDSLSEQQRDSKEKQLALYEKILELCEAEDVETESEGDIRMRRGMISSLAQQLALYGQQPSCVTDALHAKMAEQGRPVEERLGTITSLLGQQMSNFGQMMNEELGAAPGPSGSGQSACNIL